jgi:two-component system chemotaxis response regulator CheB
MKPVRVFVVDDSALMRKMIPQILSRDPAIEVVGTAMDGVFALQKIAELRPDVITLDVDMPRMDGLETLRHIVGDFGIPTIMVSSLTRKDADQTFRALNLGAFDFVAKPRDAISVHITDIGEELVAKVRAAAVSVGARLHAARYRPPPPAAGRKVAALPRTRAEKILAIGISTGGPNALSYLLPRLPKEFPAAILIVQHMPAGFTRMFADRLNASCAIEVREARDGDLVLPGRALVAPGNRHLKLKRLPLGTIAVLSDAPAVSGHRPSADVLFHAAALEYGRAAVGLIMTGMGADGAEGLGAIKREGGLTLAQDEASCVVFGMPKVAIEMGNVGKVLPLEEMEPFLCEHYGVKEVERGDRRSKEA